MLCKTNGGTEKCRHSADKLSIQYLKLGGPYWESVMRKTIDLWLMCVKRVVVFIVWLMKVV